MPAKAAASKKIAPKANPALLRRMYRHMLLLRILDEKMLGLQRQGRIGFFGTVTGEEASIIGSAAAAEPTDWVFPALRQGGVLLWRGCPLSVLIAQCMGNAADLLKGRQMPAHSSDRKYNLVAWSSVIGNQLPQAVGAAYAAKRKGDRAVVLAYLGDGATSSADFHAAMNFAGVWKVPVVLFCQNNQWAISVPRSRQTATRSIAGKAVAYGLEGVQVDGNDAVAVYLATRAAVGKARAGKGPTFIEAVTYRLGGHSSSDDPAQYRDPAQVEKWREKDPIPRMRARLAQTAGWTDREDAALRDRIKSEIDQAVRDVEQAGPPPLATLFDDVYARIPAHLEEQRVSLTEEMKERTESHGGGGVFPL